MALSPGNASGIRWALCVGSNALQGVGWAGPGSGVNLGAESIAVNTLKLRTYIKSSTVWNIWSNGSQISTNIADNSMPASATITGKIGSEAGEGGYWLSGPNITDIQFNIVLTTTQRTAIENMINTYYAIY